MIYARIMKRRVLFLFLTILSVTFFNGELVAQIYRGCGSGTLSNPTTTPSTCDNTGSIKIQYTITGASKAIIGVYRDGTESSPLKEETVSGASGSYTFQHLGAGKYTVILRCEENPNTIYAKKTSVQVDGPPALDGKLISNKIRIEDLCGDFTQGGTIVVDNLTGIGGTPPYQVSIIKNDNPGYDDANSQYVTPSTYPYKKKVDQFGKYQIRVKDKCKAYVTITKEVSPKIPPLKVGWSAKKECGNKTRLEFHTIRDSNNNNQLFPEEGIKLVLRGERPDGPIHYNGLYKKGSNVPPSITVPMASNHKYYVKTTNSCGVEYEYEISYNNGCWHGGEVSCHEELAQLVGCENTGYTMTIYLRLNNYWAFPVKAEVRPKSNLNSVVQTQTFKVDTQLAFEGLGARDYEVWLTDKCGQVTKVPIKKPVAGAGVKILSIQELRWKCTSAGGPLTQEGATQVVITFSGITDKNAKVTIVSGPSNVGVSGFYYATENRYGWTNMLPGHYRLRVVQCGKTEHLEFDVSDKHILKQSVTAKGESFCTGGGTITGTKVYNGDGRVYFQLLDNQGRVKGENTTGVFPNLSPGKYRVRLKIDICDQIYYVNATNEIELVDGATGPKIQNYVGVICENSDGTPLGTGSIHLDLVGSKPLNLEYYDVTNPSQKFTVPINSDLSFASVKVEGLQAYHKYHFDLKDGCGKQGTQEITVQTLSNSLSVSNPVHPCYGDSYTLEMAYSPGASYKWKNPQGVTVSNSRLKEFAKYSESDDGKYVCEISWDGCVRRRVEVTLDGRKCGEPLNSKNYWFGTTDNEWNKPENWTATKVPLKGEDVEFATASNNNGKPAVRDLHVPVSDPKEIKDLINDSDKDLIIVSDSQLKINGEVKDSNLDAGTIIVKSSKDAPTGTLIFTNPDKNKNVSATVEFYSKAYDCADCGMYRRSWQYFGIPIKNIANFPKGDVSGEETIRQWVEPFNGDKWQQAPYLDSELRKFKGYEITNNTTTEPTDVYKLKGELVVGDAKVDLTKTLSVNYSGANLVGNSYTAAISIKDALVLPSEVKKTIYLFNTGTRDQWRKLDGSTVSGHQGGRYLAVPQNLAGSGNLPDRIPSMQTFMVLKESGTSSQLHIKYDKLVKNTKVNDGNGQQIVLRSAETEVVNTSGSAMPTLIMDVLGGGSADRIWIFAKDGTTLGFDDGWDGHKMPETGIVQLYTIGENSEDHFAVTTLPDWDNLSIGFEAPVDDKYELQFALSGTAPDAELYLYDLIADKRVRIKNGATYMFEAKKGDVNARFRLAYSGSSLISTDESALIGLSSTESGRVTISNDSKYACTLYISSLDGQLLKQVEVGAHQTRVVDGLPAGVCIVRIQNTLVGDVRKVMIKD